jgi:hypothetical protein
MLEGNSRLIRSLDSFREVGEGWPPVSHGQEQRSSVVFTIRTSHTYWTEPYRHGQIPLTCGPSIPNRGNTYGSVS